MNSPAPTSSTKENASFAITGAFRNLAEPLAVKFEVRNSSAEPPFYFRCQNADLLHHLFLAFETQYATNHSRDAIPVFGFAHQLLQTEFCY